MVKTSGTPHGEGITMIELHEKFPDEETTKAWFEKQRWPDKSYECPHCGSSSVSVIESSKPMPFRCKTCRKHFSVRTGTAMEWSKIPLQKWAFSIYLSIASPIGMSSVRLHRDLGITQKSAWFMAHRIREAFGQPVENFAGPVEVDETYTRGKRKNTPKSRRKEIAGHGTVEKVVMTVADGYETNQVSTHRSPC